MINLGELVNAVSPKLANDSARTVASTSDRSQWYKVLFAPRRLLVPPVSVLRVNMVELANFVEAVQAFEVMCFDSPSYLWGDNDLNLHSYTRPEDQVAALEARQRVGGLTAWDIETKRVHWEDNCILAIGCATDGNTAHAWYPEVKGVWSPQVVDSFAQTFKTDREHMQFLWHNGKFDCGRLKYLWDIDVRVDQDTMLQHYSQISEVRGSHGLKQLGQLYLQAPAWDDVLDVQKKQWARANKTKLADFTYDMLDTETLIPYMQRDTIATYRLHEVFNKLAREDSDKLYRNLIRASRVFMNIELTGQQVDFDWMDDVEYKLEKQIKQAEKDLHEASSTFWSREKYMKETGAKSAGEKFLPTSPAQLKWLLRQITGESIESTDAMVIADLQERYPEEASIQSLSTLRKANKYMKTYCTGLRDVVCGDCRVRGTFNLHGTETGRLSSSSPNVQNIPRDPLIKNIIAASDGYELLQLDYSQAELRVLAIVSNDPFLIDTYNKGLDLHSAVAMDLYGPDFTSEDRSICKSINFGIVYGRGPSSIAEHFDRTRAEAQQIIDAWFASKPGVKAYIDGQRAKAYAGESCIIPSTGRARHFVLTDDTAYHVANEFVNTPIQSLASDCTLEAVCEIYEWIEESKIDVRLVSTVHDSIILEVRPQDLRGVAKHCMHIMSESPKKVFEMSELPIPFVADAEHGVRWGELTSFEL